MGAKTPAKEGPKRKRRTISDATLLKYTLAVIEEQGLAETDTIETFVIALKEKVLAEAMGD